MIEFFRWLFIDVKITMTEIQNSKPIKPIKFSQLDFKLGFCDQRTRWRIYFLRFDA